MEPRLPKRPPSRLHYRPGWGKHRRAPQFDAHELPGTDKARGRLEPPVTVRHFVAEADALGSI